MYWIMLLVHFPWLIVVPLLVFLLWVEPGDEFVNEEPVESAYEDQPFDNSEHWPGFYLSPPKPFPPGFSRARGSSYFNPLGPVHLRVLVRTE